MAMYSNPGEQYKQQSAMTASPGELTLMLYDGCIKDLKLAKLYIDEKDVEKANDASQKAQAIIGELMRTLDTRYEIGTQLLALYDFILDIVVRSNVQKEIELIDQAIGYITELRDSWKEAVQTNRKEMFGSQKAI